METKKPFLEISVVEVAALLGHLVEKDS